jgi:hypothetical protein
MRKIIIIAASLAIASPASAAGFGFGWNYGPGGGCWVNCGRGGVTGFAVLGTMAAAGVVGAVVRGLTPPPPPPRPAPPQYGSSPNTAPGCYQAEGTDPSGRMFVETICP